MSRPYRHASKGRPTPKRGAQRRRRYLLWALAKHSPDQRQWRGAMALYSLMLNRWSDDDAKGVFPSQVRMGGSWVAVTVRSAGTWSCSSPPGS